MRFAAWLALPALLCLSLPAPAAVAVGAKLLKDLVTTEETRYSDPAGFTTLGDRVFYTAERNGTGRELFELGAGWTTPRLVADFAPGGASSAARIHGHIGPLLIMEAEIGRSTELAEPYQAQLLAYDTQNYSFIQLTQLPPYSANFPGRMQYVGTFNGRLLLSAEDRSLWITDGTPAGTRRLFQSGDTHEPPLSADQVCTLPDRIQFMANGSGGEPQLWLSNGTPAGTGILASYSVDANYVYRTAGSAGACWFLRTSSGRSGWQLWASNGTAAGSGIVRQSPNGEPHQLVSLDGSALFTESNFRTAPEFRLWHSSFDQPLLTAAPGTSTDVDNLALAYAGRLVLTVPAEPTAGGQWHVAVSDGTPGGTRRVQAGGADLLLAEPVRLTPQDGQLLVRGGARTLRIDVDNAQSQDIGDVQLFTGDVAQLGGRFYYSGFSLPMGTEVWSADGDPASARPIEDQTRATRNGMESSQYGVISEGNAMIFVGSFWDGGYRRRLWHTQGSEATTWQMDPVRYGGGEIDSLQRLGNDLFFTVLENQPPSEHRGYRASLDFLSLSPVWAPPPGWQTAPRPVSYGNGLVFACLTGEAQSLCGMTATDSSVTTLFGGDADFNYYELGSTAGAALLFYRGGLWRSDGTVPGTFELLPGLRVPSQPGYVAISQRIAGSLLFQACTGTAMGSCGLYLSDGSMAGTRRLVDMDGAIYQYATMTGRVFFAAVHDGYSALWLTDGSVSGTRRLGNLSGTIFGLYAAGSNLHLMRNEPLAPSTYWVTDIISLAGLRRVMLPEGVEPVAGRTYGGFIQSLDAATVIFSCKSPQTGYELCSVDSEGFGARIAVDFKPGPASGYPQLMGRTSDALYVIVDDGVHGYEPWRLVPLGDLVFADRF